MGYRPHSQNPRPTTTLHRVEPNDSVVPSCGGASIGSEKNPELIGDDVPNLIAALDGGTGFARITARDDGKWVLEQFEVPEE